MKSGHDAFSTLISGSLGVPFIRKRAGIGNNMKAKYKIQRKRMKGSGVRKPTKFLCIACVSKPPALSTADENFATLALF